MFSHMAEQGWGRQMTEFHPGLGLHRLSVTKQESGEAAEVARQGAVPTCPSARAAGPEERGCRHWRLGAREARDEQSRAQRL